MPIFASALAHPLSVRPISPRTAAITVAAVAVSAIAVPTPAAAADPVPLPQFEPAPLSAPAHRWSGFYVGFGIDGFGGGVEVPTGIGTQFDRGQLGILPSVHVGYNFAPIGGGATGWMLGLEADLSVGEMTEERTVAGLGAVVLESNFAASARMRAGYAFERVYLYGTAGVAVSDFNLKPASNDDRDINAAPVLGLGAEVALSEKWTARGEALAYGFEPDAYEFSGTSRESELSVGTVRLGFSRKF